MKNKQTKIFVVGGSGNYANWIQNSVLTSKFKEADLILFTGGEDITPSIYNEDIGNYTSHNLSRDLKEMDAFDEAKKLGKPMLGICRGSQLLCVMSGGRLIQHQENRKYIHPIKTYIGEVVDITSTHHQAQYPYDMKENEYKLLGWTEDLSKFHLDGKNKEISRIHFKEAEIVFYPQTNCLGIQGHPESMWRDRDGYKDTFNFLNILIENLLNKNF